MLNFEYSEPKNLKIGDLVKIKPNLKEYTYYDNIIYRKEYDKYVGNVYKIEEIKWSYLCNVAIKLKGVESDRYDETYYFSEGMLELVKRNEDMTNLDKALELLNMTEEEMLKEYDKINKDKLIDNMIKEFDEFCDKYNMSECESKCKYKGNSGICSMLFAMEYLQEKGLLKENINENN